MGIMENVGTSVLSSTVYDVFKFIFSNNVEKIQLDKIDKQIKAELFKKHRSF